MLSHSAWHRSNLSNKVQQRGMCWVTQKAKGLLGHETVSSHSPSLPTQIKMLPLCSNNKKRKWEDFKLNLYFLKFTYIFSNKRSNLLYKFKEVSRLMLSASNAQSNYKWQCPRAFYSNICTPDESCRATYARYFYCRITKNSTFIISPNRKKSQWSVFRREWTPTLPSWRDTGHNEQTAQKLQKVDPSVDFVYQGPASKPCPGAPSKWKRQSSSQHLQPQPSLQKQTRVERSTSPRHHILAIVLTTRIVPTAVCLPGNVPSPKPIVHCFTWGWGVWGWFFPLGVNKWIKWTVGLRKAIFPGRQTGLFAVGTMQ